MFLKVMFIAAFLFIFCVAAILLKPLSFHVKRKYSTASLKFTYLAYLVIILVFTFMFMFYNGSSVFYLEDTEDPRAAMHFSLMLTALLIPNAGILIRRKIKRRTGYNIAFTIINIGFGLYFLFLIKKAF